ncbi:MAG: hypothetical protein NT067_03840 [Candidatus Diapherotrites archaeon]|nr:hypothetical protein [Candidatus Diapherotrites archaeon]
MRQQSFSRRQPARRRETRKPASVPFTKGEKVRIAGGSFKGEKGEIANAGKRSSTVHISQSTVRRIEKSVTVYDRDGKSRKPVELYDGVIRSRMVGVDNRDLAAHEPSKGRPQRRKRRIDPASRKLDEIFKLRNQIHDTEVRYDKRSIEALRIRELLNPKILKLRGDLTNIGKIEGISGRGITGTKRSGQAQRHRGRQGTKQAIGEYRDVALRNGEEFAAEAEWPQERAGAKVGAYGGRSKAGTTVKGRIPRKTALALRRMARQKSK